MLLFTEKPINHIYDLYAHLLIYDKSTLKLTRYLVKLICYVIPFWADAIDQKFKDLIAKVDAT